MRRTIFVWDAFVRLFHWSLVAAFTANAFFTEDESSLHRYVGYTVLALVIARVVWGLFGSRHARFSDFPPDPAAAVGQLAEMATGRRHAHAGHSPLGALMIYNLLATLLVIGISGYMMTTLAFFGIEWVEELHEAAVLWAEASVVLHIAAVVFESRRLGINLPRSMVTGYKTLPED
ncbi:cytochrome b/b6 domain-containing protein [Gemmobacter fulvus]|uniref:Cytochrome b/b6 domain-containing protein n=1 Tax=Gemmobacter fulvus TaxID=2840474 RepID=A0A975P7E8_9RHOB|nr:cytochrome b/b6 domain-containing protein [Gemmobacter fulvus]MBT9248086.1 cytochrome b/b6 domain-containing protein [Gemmobacter fulvus]MDQ1847755.1 cytochrome b/b6 domain-containing protein [Gemmobacter fulvus]QWK90777.1 cytochrome b/b6 domain-containing protein [Gemmobacter fulvus]